MIHAGQHPQPQRKICQLTGEAGIGLHSVRARSAEIVRMHEDAQRFCGSRRANRRSKKRTPVLLAALLGDGQKMKPDSPNNLAGEKY
jgi:hypothetical protein